MIHVIIILNPFEPARGRKDYYEEWEADKPLHAYHNEQGKKVYAVDGVKAGPNDTVEDGQEIVVAPVMGRRFFRGILGVGLLWAAGAMGAGAIFGKALLGWRLAGAFALAMIGNHIVNKLTPQPKVDLSNTEQENTYGWGAPQTLTGQGYVLPTVYGTVKTAGIMLQRHVVSDGKKQYLNILYCLAEGEIDDIDDIRLNGNPISNYTDVDIQIRKGGNQQEVISNFNNSYADTALAYELNPESDWSTVELDGNTAQGIEITLSFPIGLYYSNDKGKPDWTGVTIKAQYRKKGETDWHDFSIPNENTKAGNDGIIRQKTNAAFYRMYGAYDLEPAQYEVRVRCSQKDRNDIRTANKVQWVAVTQIIYDDFAYPGKALLGLKALATDQLSGSDPQMTCLITRKHILAWNPVSGDYEEKDADNPAWAAYDILHHCRKLKREDGTYAYEADGIPKENMDYYAFQAWAAMCREANNTFNYLYDSAQKLWDALNAPCRVGRGSVIIVGTKVSCVYDYASDPVQLFTVANIKKDSFSNEYQSTEDRANCIEISFMNKDKNYERDVLAVYGDNYNDADTTSQPSQVELMGCTSLKQAYEYGKFKLRSNKYEVRTVQFDAFADAIACEIGDVITVQSDVTEWGLGGRIESVEGNVLTLDQDIAEAGDGYTNIIVRNNSTDEIIRQKVTTYGKNTVTVDNAEGMEAGCVYALGSATRQAKNFKVLSISADVNEETRTITAVEYYPELYSLNTDDVPIPDNPRTVVEPPKNLSLTTEKYASKDDGAATMIHMNWMNPREAHIVYLDISTDGVEWTREKTFTLGEDTYSMAAIRGTRYYVRLYAENELGIRSTVISDSILAGETLSTDYIPPVTNLRAYNRYREQADGIARYDIVVEWDKPDFDSFQEAQVWYKTNNARGEDAVMQEGVPADQIGFFGGWQFAGSGEDKVTIPQAVAGDTYRICVVTKDIWGNVTSRDAAPTIDILVAIKTTVPNTPDGFSITFGANATASWDEVTNSDIAWYEIRTDKNPGAETEGLLARVTGLSTALPLTERQGVIYLYARSAQGKYSYPAVLSYNKQAPEKPSVPKLTPKLGGMVIDAGYIPTGCIGMKTYIESTDGNRELSTTNSVITYMCPAGVYEVRTSYYDLFGEGPKSDPSTVTVKTQIHEEDIADQAITKEKVDTTIQKAIEDTQQALPDAIGEAKQQAANIEAALNKLPAESGYKAITELKTTTDSIASTVAANKRDQDGTNETMLTGINQNAGAISSMAATLNGEPDAEGQYKAISAIKQTADSIASTVAKNKTAQDGTNETLQSSIKQNADSITALVTNLGDKDKAVKNYAAISIMNDAIASKVTQDDVTSYFQQDHTGFYIKGSLIRVDGDTKFEKGVIAKNIEAGSITADKLAAKSLSALGMTIGTLGGTTGARMVLSDSLIEVYDANGTLRVRMGVW